MVAAIAGTSYPLRSGGSAEACVYTGPEEVAGNFEVRASKAGYETATRTVRVDADECHVMQVQVAVDLRPLS